jgi:hypothetical protein
VDRRASVLLAHSSLGICRPRIFEKLRARVTWTYCRTYSAQFGSRAVFFDVEARSPWVATTPAAAKIAPSVMPEAEHVIQFHAITSGGCWAELLDGSMPPLHLAEGDIVILPMGDQHVFCSEPGLRAEVNLKIYYRPTDRQLPFQVSPPGGDGESTRFTCGYLGCDARPFNPVLQSLPRLLHSRAAEGGGYMVQLIQMAIEETATRRAGGETVLSKLAELMFVDVLRRHIDKLPNEAGGGCLDCAISTSARRLRSCTASPPRHGRWSDLRTRSDFHAPFLQIASHISFRIRLCST